jgi:hypothetical protein
MYLAFIVPESRNVSLSYKLVELQMIIGAVGVCKCGLPLTSLSCMEPHAYMPNHDHVPSSKESDHPKAA